MDEVEVGRVNNVIDLLKLKDVIAVDSYAMSANGPILSSVFLLSGGMLTEVKMGGKYLKFDSCNASQMHNYRVSFGEHQVQPEASPKGHDQASVPSEPAAATAAGAITKFVTVHVRHTESLASELTFFGEDLDAWLTFVLDVYPSQLIIR